MLAFEEISHYQENNRIEAKRASGGFPHSLWETYSSFANTVGGLILLGVEERKDKSFHPVDLPSPQWLVEKFWEQVNDPAIVNRNFLEPEQVRIVIAEGKPIVLIEIPRANRKQRPIYIGSSVFQGTYKRTGEGDYRCSHEEVEQMLFEQTLTPFDMEALPDLTATALHRASVRQYHKKYLEHHPTASDTESDPAFLKRVGVLVELPDGALHPTRAGLLLLGNTSTILQTFPGFRLIYRVKETHSFGWSTLIDTKNSAKSGNLFQFFCETTLKLKKYITTLPDLTDAQLEELYFAAEEGIANGLMHANYSSEHAIILSQKQNVVWFSNPGIPSYDKQPLLFGGVPMPRNELLVDLFYLVGVGHKLGSGLVKISEIWKRHGWLSPKLEHNPYSGDTVFTLVFSSEDSTLLREMRRELLLDYLTDHRSATFTEIAKALQLGPVETMALLKPLIKEEIILQDDFRYILKM